MFDKFVVVIGKEIFGIILGWIFIEVDVCLLFDIVVMIEKVECLV